MRGLVSLKLLSVQQSGFRMVVYAYYVAKRNKNINIACKTIDYRVKKFLYEIK
jgi:hypothetical protein